MCTNIYRDPFYLHGLTLTLARRSNFIHHNVWDEIPNSFPNFKGYIVEG